MLLFKIIAFIILVLFIGLFILKRTSKYVLQSGSLKHLRNANFNENLDYYQFSLRPLSKVFNAFPNIKDYFYIVEKSTDIKKDSQKERILNLLKQGYPLKYKDVKLAFKYTNEYKTLMLHKLTYSKKEQTAANNTFLDNVVPAKATKIRTDIVKSDIKEENKNNSDINTEKDFTFNDLMKKAEHDEWVKQPLMSKVVFPDLKQIEKRKKEAKKAVNGGNFLNNIMNYSEDPLKADLNNGRKSETKKKKLF